MPKHLEQFCEAYRQVPGTKEEMIKTLLKLLAAPPFKFAPYHKKIRAPFDHYQFSLDFVRPLIDFSKSKVIGHLTQIEKQLCAKENVILLANHQTEADPQIISLLLEKTHPHIGEKIIYVAGERVVTDPLAIPFSMGCDLLCIYSKRYIDNPPELKNEKQLHNKHTMELMSRLLQEGGKIIYVAPSGGRDRKGADGKIDVAPFDPQSLEMFALMAKKAKTPTRFYPLALHTYELLPPPKTIQIELGEKRTMRKAAASIALLEEFDMEKFPGSEENEKIARRQKRADAIWNLVKLQHEGMVCS
jgi:glycerol-3-phosphate O-acyltransferase